MTWPWGSRREGEPTNQYLARVLADYAGLMGLSQNALNYWYDDYFCPPDIDDGMNLHRLVADMQSATRRAPRIARIRAEEVAKAAAAGEFDGTREEANRWGESPAGQATMRELMRGA